MRRRFFIGRSRLGGRHLGGEREGQTIRNTLPFAPVGSRKSGIRASWSKQQVANLRSTQYRCGVNYPTHRSSPAGVGPVVKLLFQRWRLPNRACRTYRRWRRSRPRTFALVFQRYVVDSFIALCLNQGMVLPRLCGTPCRGIAVSHSLRLRGNPLRHAADVLANFVSTAPWLTCICFWVFEVITAPSCTWRQAVLRLSSPPALRFISVYIAGVPRQAYCLFYAAKLLPPSGMSRSWRFSFAEKSS